jgi:hypothetical protein
MAENINNDIVINVKGENLDDDELELSKISNEINKIDYEEKNKSSIFNLLKNKKKPKNNNNDEKINRQQVDKIDLNKSWNNMIVLQLKKIAEKSAGYRWMHFNEQTYYFNLERVLSVLEAIFLSINIIITSGEVISLLSESGIDSKDIIYMNVIQIFIMIIFTIIKTIRETGNYVKLKLMHQHTSIKFYKIFNNIQNQLCLAIKDRKNDKKFLFSQAKIFNDLLYNSPSIRKKAMDKYAHETEQYDIAKPLLIGGLDDIEVVVVTNDNSDDQKIDIKVGEPKLNYSESSRNLDNLVKYDIYKWLKSF